MAWNRLFQFAGLGSHTSIPIPAEVDGASAGPGFPGPTFSFTKHMSLAAFGVCAVAEPERTKGSPFANALTSYTVV